MTTKVIVRSTTPKGNQALFACREDTSDASLVGGISDEDEYRLTDLPVLSGWAVDVGAHIGIVSVILALDHPDLHVIAVEALPENATLIRENVQINGLSERITVVEAAATDDETEKVDITYGWSWSLNQPDAYMRDARFIGGMVPANDSSITLACPGIGLARLLADIEDVALLKIDCEGCEWDVLRSPAIARVERILGEYHNGAGFAGIVDLLAGHEVMHRGGTNIGHFEAVRR